ncbi:MAG: CsbD family protein [Candidatus Sulfotelmatobacter sp.]
MDKDRVEGKVKDVAGRVERQVGEWTGDPEKQVHGAAKQVEGKVQNAWGKAKDAADSAAKGHRASSDVDDTNADEEEDRKLRSERKAG